MLAVTAISCAKKDNKANKSSPQEESAIANLDTEKLSEYYPKFNNTDFKSAVILTPKDFNALNVIISFAQEKNALAYQGGGIVKLEDKDPNQDYCFFNTLDKNVLKSDTKIALDKYDESVDRLFLTDTQLSLDITCFKVKKNDLYNFEDINEIFNGIAEVTKGIVNK